MPRCTSLFYVGRAYNLLFYRTLGKSKEALRAVAENVNLSMIELRTRRRQANSLFYVSRAYNLLFYRRCHKGPKIRLLAPYAPRPKRNLFVV